MLIRSLELHQIAHRPSGQVWAIATNPLIGICLEPFATNGLDGLGVWRCLRITFRHMDIVVNILTPATVDVMRLGCAAAVLVMDGRRVAPILLMSVCAGLVPDLIANRIMHLCLCCPGNHYQGKCC